MAVSKGMTMIVIGVIGIATTLLLGIISLLLSSKKKNVDFDAISESGRGINTSKFNNKPVSDSEIDALFLNKAQSTELLNNAKNIERQQNNYETILLSEEENTELLDEQKETVLLKDNNETSLLDKGDEASGKN
jgi:hypothetical protein